MRLRNVLSGDDPPDIEVGMVTEILSNERRRQVIDLLSETESVDLSSVAEQIAELEDGDNGSQSRKRVYIALHQCHLPKMDDNDVVRYDIDRKTIERGGKFQSTLWALKRLTT